MKAAVLMAPGDLRVMDVPRPRPAPGEVLVRVAACGICGSDVKYFHGLNPWAQHTLGRHVDNPPGMILGHEFGGVVVEAGSPGDSDLVGRRVGVEPYNTCGRCDDCIAGNYHLCRSTRHIGHGAGWGERDFYPGGMAEYCTVWATHVFPLPDAIEDAAVPLLDPLAVAVHAARQAGVGPGKSVLVLGAGTVGLCALQTALAWGAHRVCCTDVSDFCLALAREAGAALALRADTPGLVHALCDRGLYDCVLDSVGSAETFPLGLAALKNRGAYVSLVADPAVQLPFTLAALSGEKRISISANNTYDDYAEGIRLMAAGHILAGRMVTHTLPLDRVHEGLALMEGKAGGAVMKVNILP